MQLRSTRRQLFGPRWLQRGLGVALAAALILSGLTGTAEARRAGSVEPRILAARAVAASVVQVAGRATSKTVRVQRFNRAHWRTVTSVGVRHHRFSVRLTQHRTRARYRVLSGRRASSPVVIATTARVAARPGTTDLCGTRPAKPDGSLWSCTFADDFSGSTLDRTKWIPQTVFTTGTADAYACYQDSPNNIALSSGALHLTVRRETTPVPCARQTFGATASYSGGMVSTYHLFSQKFGRFEARVRTTATRAPGLQEAFWLWPDDRYADGTVWPAAGEIDVVETYSQYPDNAVPYLHYTANDNGGPTPGVNTAWNCLAPRGVWNTYTLEWSATSLKILVNGKTCLVNTSADPAFAKPYIVALTQALGVGTNAATSSTPIPATTDVDYVRVWR